MLTATLKPKTCQQCSREFMPARLMQAVCGPLCASRKARKDRVTKEAAERAQTRQQREDMKGLPTLKYEAQAAFNTFIRLRDKGKPCICCGRPLDDSGGVRGAGFDCGHYRSVGSAPHLRYDERNAHGQTKHCNRHGAGRAVDYRIGLIARIGLEAVEALEADNRVHKWTREELIAIRDTYRARVRAAKKEQA